nr:hypothetical protein [Gammaproteobacteria bacterium]NIR30911.1 hypothetical protein [Gammaproteobacteria bacterium]NIR98518.1 hypothetical protein [Gammaproteobacteria bacterium]NIT64816.1 hypothetical protein [Gammaproteobacteria bacterium]NIV20097.1 hypothetical protein [Gammaproteobacteria bacterium]
DLQAFADDDLGGLGDFADDLDDVALEEDGADDAAAESAPEADPEKDA